MKYEILKDGIVYFESAIDNIQEIINIIESLSNEAVSEWSPWKASDNFYYGEMKHFAVHNLKNIKNLDSKNKTSFVINKITDAMKECATIYASEFDLDKKELEYAISVLKSEGFSDTTIISICKYDYSGYMGPHVDINTDQYYMAYTIVVYLNDDYEGGELNFPKLNVKIKPKAGSVMMYPSGEPYEHESMHLKSGRKMVITHHWRSEI